MADFFHVIAHISNNLPFYKNRFNVAFSGPELSFCGNTLEVHIFLTKWSNMISDNIIHIFVVTLPGPALGIKKGLLMGNYMSGKFIFNGFSPSKGIRHEFAIIHRTFHTDQHCKVFFITNM